MPKATSYIPQGLPALVPQLVAKDARKLVEFLTKAFGAEVGDLMPTPDGSGIMHGYVRLAGATLFVADPFGPAAPTASNTMIYFQDVDAVFERATKAGAEVVVPLSDMFWGDRWGILRDPFGNTWQVATHVEDVAPDEMKRRMAAQKP